MVLQKNSRAIRIWYLFALLLIFVHNYCSCILIGIYSLFGLQQKLALLSGDSES